MTRAEIKRQKREAEKADKKIMMTQAEINRIKAEATERVFIAMLGLPLIVLRDKFGFGKERLTKFEEAMIEQLSCVQDEYVKLDELKTLIESETGMNIQKTKWEMR